MNPYPVHDPRHNLRELIKECILIERHLFDPSKYCQDCIRKHFLTIEAFAGSELASLDIDQEFTDAINLLSVSIPNWQKAWTAGYDPREIAQEIRQIRKKLSPACFGSSDLEHVDAVDMMLYGTTGGQMTQVAQVAQVAQRQSPFFNIVCPNCEQLLQIDIGE